MELKNKKKLNNVIVHFNNSWTQLNVDVINITKIFFLKVLNYIFKDFFKYRNKTVRNCKELSRTVSNCKEL